MTQCHLNEFQSVIDWNWRRWRRAHVFGFGPRLHNWINLHIQLLRFPCFNYRGRGVCVCVCVCPHFSFARSFNRLQQSIQRRQSILLIPVILFFFFFCRFFGLWNGASFESLSICLEFNLKNRVSMRPVLCGVMTGVPPDLALLPKIISPR